MKILIADIRKKKGITQTVLADSAGISRPYLAQIEQGKRNLSLKYQKLIADALNVSTSELVDFDANTSDADLIMSAFESLSGPQRQVWLQLARSVLQSDGDAQEPGG